MVKNTRKKILIISHDKIGSNMAGPGIRYHHMAEFLSKDFQVTVGFFDPNYLPSESFRRSYETTHIDATDFHENLSGKDIVISMWLSEDMMKYCKEHNTYVVFDIYAPIPVEGLVLYLHDGDPITKSTDFSHRQTYNMIEKFFQYGDLFLFSNRRQLNFWMGYAFGTGMISVSNYKKRALFDRFIYAPMGIDTSTPLSHSKTVIKNVMHGIEQDDTVIIWTGGIWNWFDGEIAIEAMNELRDIRPDIKLVFLGTKHPNPDVPAMSEATNTISLAKKYNLLGSTVFVYDGWVPYDERINYLIEADAAINTTKNTIESEVAHRTRVLDHFLTMLPTISTSGDYLSDDIIKPLELGVVVPPRDKEALVQAILQITNKNNNERIRKNIEKIRPLYRWEQTLHSLREELLFNAKKLPFVEIKKPRELHKDRLSYRLMKKLLPQPLKKLLIEIFQYER